VVANSEQRYKPFGELRVAGSGQPSKYTFTGHYEKRLMVWRRRTLSFGQQCWPD
jgi:hypothetical protein